jgi:hypothetical protein
VGRRRDAPRRGPPEETPVSGEPFRSRDVHPRRRRRTAAAQDAPRRPGGRDRRERTCCCSPTPTPASRARAGGRRPGGGMDPGETEERDRAAGTRGGDRPGRRGRPTWWGRCCAGSRRTGTPTRCASRPSAFYVVTRPPVRGGHGRADRRRAGDPRRARVGAAGRRGSTTCPSRCGRPSSHSRGSSPPPPAIPSALAGRRGPGRGVHRVPIGNLVDPASRQD